jgi:putative tryptophan/tyrosine transport system ATP-binding protein
MLELHRLTKSFNVDGEPLHDRKAVQELNLSIQDHDFVVVIGGNGSGKSTLLSLIAGSLRPDYGTIALDGRDISHLSEHRRARFIGRVFQDPLRGTIPDFTLFENLALAANRGRPHTLRWSMTSARRKEFVELLAPLNLGLESRLDERVKNFSGGERQAVTLLMATFNEPKLLLLDEHTAALDPKTSKMVMGLTEKIAASINAPTLMITHNLRDAIRYGSRLIMMKDGRITFDCGEKDKKNLTVEELVQKYSTSNEEEAVVELAN